MQSGLNMPKNVKLRLLVLGSLSKRPFPEVPESVEKEEVRVNDCRAWRGSERNRVKIVGGRRTRGKTRYAWGKSRIGNNCGAGLEGKSGH